MLVHVVSEVAADVGEVSSLVAGFWWFSLGLVVFSVVSGRAASASAYAWRGFAVGRSAPASPDDRSPAALDHGWRLAAAESSAAWGLVLEAVGFLGGMGLFVSAGIWVVLVGVAALNAVFF